ncbi:lactonase family protein (plasmid) [Novosphingobium sp. BL-8A]|uniref:lactonase family protein n=1 Tax=Novosphingobium sp. BL-8A TaxID=3127639 RepID=UPI0037577CD9
MRVSRLSALLALALASSCATPPKQGDCRDGACTTRLVYFGTHGQQAGQGIFGARFDEATGKLSALGEVAPLFRPTWLVADPVRPLIYAVSEQGNDGRSNGKVVSYTVDHASGSLAGIGTADAGGGGPTHLGYDPRSHSLFVANFGSGTATVLPVDLGGRIGPVAARVQDQGSGPNPRQAGPHAHGVTLDPSGRFVLVPDLGADRTFVYRFDPRTRRLSPAPRPYAQVPAGTGPRHVVFGRGGRYAYLATELTAQVIVYRWDASNGGLDPVQTLDLTPAGFTGQRSAAEIAVSRDGRFLYVSSREGEDAIYVFAVDPAQGTLIEVQRFETGKRPWSFALSPGEQWMLVAEEAAGHVAVLARDPESGKLGATDNGIAVYQPVNVTFAH